MLPAIPCSELHATGTHSGCFFRMHVCMVTRHNKMIGIFYPYFPMLLLLRPVACFAPPLQAIFAPCGPLMGVLTVMHFSHVLLLQYRHFCHPPWAIDGCPPSDAIFTSCPYITGKVDGCLPSDAVLPPVGRLVVVLPVRQPCPLWAFLVSCPFQRQPCPLQAFW